MGANFRAAADRDGGLAGNRRLPDNGRFPTSAGSPTEAPTKKDPLRFSAFNVSMNTGMAGETEIVSSGGPLRMNGPSCSGWSRRPSTAREDSESFSMRCRKSSPASATSGRRTASDGISRYAVENTLPDGTRQIVVVTDKPVSFAAAAGGSDVMDYPFTLIEMRMKPNEKGEGKMLVATSITTKNGRLELENYGNEPVRLTQITEEEKKDKKDKKDK